jgi:hypothetical protein
MRVRPGGQAPHQDAGYQPPRAMSESFLFLFFKKEAFLPFFVPKIQA